MSVAREVRTSAGRRSRVGLALAGVVVALLAPLAPAQAAAPTIAVSRGSVIGGESVTVSGRIGQAKARSVVLQRQSGKSWVKVVASRSTTAGAYKFLFKPPTKVGSKTVLRVIAPAVKVGKKVKYKQITTGGRSVLTVAQAASMTAPDNVSQDAAFLVSGKFSPARPGRTVAVQKFVNGTWLGIGKSGLESATGTVSIPVSYATTGDVQTRLVALASGGAPAFASAAKTITVFLAAPTGLTTSTNSPNVVHLSWNAVSGVKYNVYQSTDPSFQAPTKVTSSPITPNQYDVNGLTNGVKYYFAVTSVNATDESAFSATANATPVAAADTTPPPVPTNVTAEAGAASAQVSWSPVSANDLAGYNVYRATSASGPWTKLTTSSPVTGTTYGVTGLTNGTEYFFAVTSVDNATPNPNESAKSSAASATPAPGADTTAPPVPTGVNATAGTASAQITWTAVSAGDLQGYNVYRSTSVNGTYTKLTASPVTDLVYTATGLTNGTQYFFAVTSIDNSGNESDKSTAASATPVAGPSGWSAVSAGRRHTCAIGTNGTLYCWGDNYYGQLGNATGLETGNAYVTPTRVGGSTGWTSVSVGDSFTCGIQAPGTLWCWGLDDHGQLGNGTSTSVPTPTPTQVGSGTTWASVSAGVDHACAVTTGGALSCWGLNANGQLGNGVASPTTDPNPTPVAVAGSGWASVSAGTDHTCATKTDHTAWCWGASISGQVGSASADPFTNSSPIQVGTGTTWASVSAGDVTSCGVLTTGALQCWGSNQYGQLGSAANTDAHPAPVAIAGGNVWAQVSVGAGTVCAVRTDHTAYCWGRRDHGQAGSTSATPLTTPTKVGTATNWTAISTANGNIDSDAGHTAAVNSAGQVFTWGANLYGQLGRAGGTDTATVGTTNPSPTPGLVPVPS